MSRAAAPPQPQPLSTRLLDGAGRALERLGLRLGPSLDADDLLRSAVARSEPPAGEDGLPLGPPLEVLTASLEDEARLSLSGRAWTRHRLASLVARRHHLDQDLRHHPEIDEVALVRPLVVVGFPRSGTTLLQNLLIRLPSSRWLRPWELDEPWPESPGAGTEDGDPRAVAHRALVERRKRLLPHLHQQHAFDSPAECNDLFMATFRSNRYAIFWRTPGYGRWLEERSRAEWVEAYRHYRQQLQRLLWRVPGERWVLKSPHHLGHLEVLLETLPDARCIHIHRDPRQVMGSLCSHVEALRRIASNRVDRGELGATLLASLARTGDRAVAARQVLEAAPAGQARVVDLAYRDLVADPVGAVRNALEALGESLPATGEDAMRSYLEADRRDGGSGGHRYRLDDFSLSPGDVETAFGSYLARFGSLC